MILLYLIISASLRGTSTAFDSTEDLLFGPPVPITPYPNPNQPDPDRLVIDETTGCLCRTIPDRISVCFGRSSCIAMPKNVTVTTSTLKLTSTHIEELRRGDFDKLSHLKALQVEGNFNLSRIVPGSFGPLVKLKNLSVSFNLNLKWLEPGTFDGLVELRTLYLIKNGLENLRSITVTLNVLNNLEKLTLNENNLVRIDATDFFPLRNSTLKELNLVLCSLEFIHPDSFLPLKRLEALRLGENNFSPETISEVVRSSINRSRLRLLNLFSAGFRMQLPVQLLEAVSGTNVTFFTLARNQFTTIDRFPYMPNIEMLDLREVLALDIKPDAFARLPRLTTLLLSGNKLPSIPKGSLLPTLKNLDLQNNAGGGNTVPSYFSISNKIFADMSQLSYLNLNFNNIYHLFNESFIGLDNLKVLGLKNSSIYHIENDTFAPLRNLAFLNLENNDFVRHNSPDGIWPDIFAGLGKLQVLLLGGCSISRFNRYGKPFAHLTNLVHLGLQNNRLERLNREDFATLTKLKSLDLSYNLLNMWDSRLFSDNGAMSSLILHHNKLSYITTSMFEDFSRLTTLELDFNAITCDCILYKSWSETTIKDKGRMLKLLSPTCCIYPITLANCSVSDFFEKVHDNCIIPKYQKLVVMLPLMLLVLFFVTLAALVYYFRWHIKYWVFLTRLYLSRKGKIQRNKTYCVTRGNNFLYDAFISYSNEDRNFVVRLASMLENYEPFIKLCVYERDFRVGSYISESILESVAKSRRTVLIISDSYAKSVWCRWESQLAEHHRLFFENEDGDYVDDSLILVKLGPVSDTHLTPTLRYLLKTRIYLRWEAEERKQKAFWDKLRQALAPPGEILENTHI